MTGLLADLDSVAEGELPPEGREVMGRVQSYVDRLRGLFRRLQTVGRAEGSAGAEDLDLVRAVSGTLEMLRGQPRLKLVDLAFEPCPALPLRATALLLDQVVMNLVLNAADATDGQGRIGCVVWQERRRRAARGPRRRAGRPRRLRAHVFEPSSAPGARAAGSACSPCAAAPRSTRAGSRCWTPTSAAPASASGSASRLGSRAA
jgi:signal transduction histidine kinase